MTKGIKYSFRAEMWKYSGKGGWHFFSLPETISSEIRAYFKSEEEGWGRMKATAKIGTTEWKTAIWFDTKQNTYLLPVKGEIRRKENIAAGDEAELVVWI